MLMTHESNRPVLQGDESDGCSHAIIYWQDRFGAAPQVLYRWIDSDV